MENYIKSNIETVFGNLEKFIKTETVVGSPIKVDDVTLIPVISVMFGCGAGSGSYAATKEIKNDGTGGGGGAKISPNEIIVIKNGEVSMLPVGSRSNLESLIKLVPEIVTKFKDTKNDSTDKENA